MTAADVAAGDDAHRDSAADRGPVRDPDRGRVRDAPEQPDVEGTGAVLAAARAQALDRLRASTGGFDELVAASRDSNADDEHDPEGATIAFERSQLDSFVTRTRAQLAEIDAAEQRLADGRYGRCEVCGQPVATARLEALPATRTCIACATQAGGRRTPGRAGGGAPSG